MVRKGSEGIWLRKQTVHYYTDQEQAKPTWLLSGQKSKDNGSRLPSTRRVIVTLHRFFYLLRVLHHRHQRAAAFLYIN